MASGKKVTKHVKKTVEVEIEESTYHLELDLDEMKALRAVLNRVGGSPERSPRRDVDAVSNAVDAAVGKGRYEWDWADSAIDCLQYGGGIYFEDYGSTDEAE